MSSQKFKPTAVPKAPPFVPFPVELLPPLIRDFVTMSAIVLRNDPSVLAGHTLVALATAIGNSRRVRLGQAWTEPCVLWHANVADSGAIKSGALDSAFQWIDKRDEENADRHGVELREWQSNKLRHEEAMRKWREGMRDGDQSAPPLLEPEPQLLSIRLEDYTPEGVMAELNHNKRGCAAAFDELSLMLSLDRYSKGKGGEEPMLLKLYGARNVSVIRKGSPKMLVKRAALSVTGCIPKGTFRAKGMAHGESGLLARFLYTMPPKRAYPYKVNARVPSKVTDGMGALFAALFALELGEKPTDVPLSPASAERWEQFVNESDGEWLGEFGKRAAAIRKLEGASARLALVIHLARVAIGGEGAPPAGMIDLESLEMGIALCRWYWNEACRIYWLLDATPEAFERDRVRETTEAEILRILEVFDKHGGELTPGALSHSVKKYRPSGASLAALERVADAGLATKHGGTKAGTWRFVKVTTGSPVTETQSPLPEAGDWLTVPTPYWVSNGARIGP